MVHDDYRIDYLGAHIREMKKAAVEDGVDLYGLHALGGCIDLSISRYGWNAQTIRLFMVDKDDDGKGTYERSPKKSFNWYKEVIVTQMEPIF